MIIVDEAMPNLTGVELVSAIRQRGINGKIIVVSAHLTPEVRDEYDRLNVDQIFTKPFNVHELRSTVDALCR
jgi:DNA-binding response OmpR family regulator